MLKIATATEAYLRGLLTIFFGGGMNVTIIAWIGNKTFRIEGDYEEIQKIMKEFEEKTSGAAEEPIYATLDVETKPELSAEEMRKIIETVEGYGWVFRGLAAYLEPDSAGPIPYIVLLFGMP